MNLGVNDLVFTHIIACKRLKINAPCPLVYIYPFPVHFNLTISDLISHRMCVFHFNSPFAQKIKTIQMVEKKRERNFLVDESHAVNFDAKTCAEKTFTSSSLNGHHQVIVIVEIFFSLLRVS